MDCDSLISSNAKSFNHIKASSSVIIAMGYDENEENLGTMRRSQSYKAFWADQEGNEEGSWSECVLYLEG